MRFCTPTLFATLFFFVMMSPTARADFLGLAPGDWNITLQGSSTLCGGTDCMGTVHIGPTGATGFDWDFTIDGVSFTWDGPTQNTSISPNGTKSCAVEDNTGSTYCVTYDLYSTTIYLSSPTQAFFLGSQPDVPGYPAVWHYYPTNDFTYASYGVWAITQIPEPPSWSLLFFGLSALGLWRRLEAKRD